jgi:diguanylate cyclase (GGDEF)-like protein
VAMGKVQAQLIEDTQKFKQISFEDALTGLKNRRYFDFRFPDLIAHHTSAKTSLSMAIIDIDAFKSINDQHGHIIGDAVLKGVANTLLAHKRAGDEVCRLGGDEFVLFMPDARLSDARAICEDVRKQFSLGDSGREYGVTLSIGVAEWNSSEDHTAFLTRADKKLFVAKREGRNRVAA